MAVFFIPPPRETPGRIGSAQWQWELTAAAATACSGMDYGVGAARGASALRGWLRPLGMGSSTSHHLSACPLPRCPTAAGATSFPPSRHPATRKTGGNRTRIRWLHRTLSLSFHRASRLDSVATPSQHYFSLL
mmetsp:Transcript_20974/g.39663  ORF Transcript_20974/g.39663 Transcript_20974/m.39663 type:complete len:133 (+) Transcript_20974:195-593(+)